MTGRQVCARPVFILERLGHGGLHPPTCGFGVLFTEKRAVQLAHNVSRKDIR